MKRRPLADDQARARLAQIKADADRLTREIDARTTKRAALRREEAALLEQLCGQLELPLASTRPASSTRAA